MYNSIAPYRVSYIAESKASVNTEISALIYFVLKIQKKISDNMHSIQKPVAPQRLFNKQ
jgi:hypothetical protein